MAGTGRSPRRASGSPWDGRSDPERAEQRSPGQAAGEGSGEPAVRPAGGPDRPRPRSAEARAARLARHAAETDPAAVLAAGMRLLELQSRTVANLRARLLRSGYPVGLVDAAAERLVELRLLDDAAYARGWLESRDRGRPRGERVLRQELRLRGVPNDIAATALDERREAGAPPDLAGLGRRGPDEASLAESPESPASADEAAASRLLERRSAALARVTDPRARRQRAYALLARNGFDPGVAARVAATVTELSQDADNETD